MAVCMTTSTSQSYPFEESDVFESQIIESIDGEKILSSTNDVTSAVAASKSITRPMSAPPIGSTTFQFGVPCSSEVILSRDTVHILSNKSRAKSFPVVQPACLFLKKYQEQIAAKRNFLKENTLSKLKLKLQRSLRDQSNEDFPFSTLPMEQLSTRYHLGDGKSSVVEHSRDQLLQFYGPRINPQSSQVITLENALEPDGSPGRICRVCHEGVGTLISPCLCAGTVALIHKDCLERWLTQTSSSSCEICRFSFRVERRPLPFYKVFGDTTNTKLRRSILIDLVCFVCLTPLALSAICLCLLSAMQNMTADVDGTIDPLLAKAHEENRQWESGCLIFLALMLLLSYVVWLSCTLNTHMKTWAEWRLASLQVKLLDIKRPCQDQIEASTYIPLAPLRLMSDDATINPSDDSTLNIPVADSPTRDQLFGSPSHSAAPVDGQAQDIPSMNGTPVYFDPCGELLLNVPRTSSSSVDGAGRTFSVSEEEEGVDGNNFAVPIQLLRG